MLAKLAFGNMRKLMHDYAVYFLTLVLGVAVFYAFNTVSMQADFLEGDVVRLLKSLGDMLQGLTVFLAFIMGFLMVYANNFLMRRRKKELGLYQVLGMRAGQVNAILTLETLMVALASFAVGLLVGSLFSQVLLFITASMFSAKIDHFSFFFSLDALRLTAICFAVTFVVMMVFNTFTLSRVHLVDLMSSGRQNEKQHVRSLPLSIVLAIAGAALVGYAWWRLTTQGFPSSVTGTGSSTEADFGITTALMIAGTYVFFYGFAGSLTMLATHLKKHYWSGLHMFTAREIASRINTTAISMATIALILFFAMTSVTTGMSLCNALNAMLEKGTPYSASVTVCTPSNETSDELIQETSQRSGVDLASLGASAQIHIGTLNATDGTAPDTFADMAALADESIPSGFEHANAYEVIGISDYNSVRKLQGLEPVSLADGHYLYLCDMDQLKGFVNKALAAGFTVKGGSETLTPERTTLIDDRSCVLENTPMGVTPGIYVVPDSVMEELDEMGVAGQTILDIRYSGSVDESDDAMDRFQKELCSIADSKDLDFTAAVTTATGVQETGVTTTGLISYLAIYIGLILVVACAAILAIQQLSAASDSSMRYRTLSELGCSDKLIFGSLRSQVCFAFLLPLIVGMAHSLCALVQVDKLIALFGYSNLWRSMLLGLGIFALVYGGYLALTYHMAHGVVKGAIRTSRHAL